MADYIPSSDGAFDGWQANFTSYVSVNAAALGLLPADVTPLTDAQTAWAPAYSGHVAAQMAAEGARQDKDDQRSAFEGIIRSLVKRLQASPAVTDAQRLAMGLTVRDPSPSPVGPPTTRPVPRVDTSERLRHTIHFVDEASPTSKAKPAGVMGCEVWVKIGEPPSVPSELTFLALDTRTPYTADYASGDAGKTAQYMLRWVSSRGDKGPWSQTVSATIGA